MGKMYQELTEPLCDFIRRQHLFFVSTAPTAGRVNVSPKGMNTFRIIDHRTVAYLDLTGSGNETAAHLEENGRATLMFCSFDQEPMILRLYGHGRVVRPGDADWEAALARFEPLPGLRHIIELSVESVQTSCGFAVPYFEFQGDRPTLARWAEQKGEEGMRSYRAEKNRRSIDGLPTGLREGAAPAAG